MHPATEYGRQFADFYDDLFPKDATADHAAAALSQLIDDSGTALELGVGTGRIAIPLARRIGHVVGVDASPEMLTLLTDDAQRAGVKVTAVEADLRTYADEQQYTLVYAVCGTLSMVTDAAEQQEAVRRAADRVAAGGFLVIETHNPSGIFKMTGDVPHFSALVPYPASDAGLLTTWNIDRNTSIWFASHMWIGKDGLRLASELSRLTTPGEIEAYATQSGLRQEQLTSDWHGTAYSDAAPMYIAVFRKPAVPGA